MFSGHTSDYQLHPRENIIQMCSRELEQQGLQFYQTFKYFNGPSETCKVQSEQTKLIDSDMVSQNS